MTLSETLSGITPASPVCKGCGQPFVRTYVTQLRCRRKCGVREIGRVRTALSAHGARTLKRAAPLQFVGVDGEGVTDPVTGTHTYALLSVGDKHLSLDGAHLQFHEVMAFLWACFEDNPEAVYVGFYLGYDFAQWLRTLPEERARMLLDGDGIAKRIRRSQNPHAPPFPVRHLGWEFDYLPKKRFKLRPEGKSPLHTPDKLVIGKGKDRRYKWMYINDVGSFFQSTFLKAINPKDNPNPVCTIAEFKLIARGKARRNTAEFDPAMVTYNQLECEILTRLMAQLEQGIREEGLKPSRSQWHGPGQVAQLWMKKIEVPKGETIRSITPEAVRDAARGSYFGGWFETFHHGLIETGHGHDVNSAYPFVMAKLPCLLHGQWEHHDLGEKGRLLRRDELRHAANTPIWGFVRAHVKGRHGLVGAMLHRNKNRSIVRPQETMGWYVTAELAAAVRAHFVDSVRVFETWTYHPCDCPPPLAPLVELYEGRLKVGKASPAGKARKLIYNSVAGKLQQSVGHPAFGNPIWGSWTTSGCRTLITDAIASHGNGLRDLLMVATDGVVFRSPHPALDLHPSRLGAWTSERHDNLNLFMPGVYWDDTARSRIAAGEAPAFKSRGIAAKDLHRHIIELDAAWGDFKAAGWPKMTLDVAFQLISPTQALARRKWDLAGTVNNDKQRVISADPSLKRRAVRPGKSKPWPRAEEIASLPYDGLFGDELRAFADSEFGDHPDGRIADILVEAVLGNAR